MDAVQKEKDIEATKEFVSTQLEVQSKLGRMAAFNSEQNTFILQILNVCKQMIEFGFYKSKDELNQLLPLLLKILDGSTDITSESEEYALHQFQKQVEQ